MKGITIFIIASVISLILLFSLRGCERIDAGHIGLKVNMVGGDRGVSQVAYVTGWVFYSKISSRVVELPVFQQHPEYEPMVVPLKGGTTFTIHPSFNYSLNASEAANMYQKLRQPLKVIEQGYMLNSLRIAIRETSNTFTVDSILNNVNTFDAAVTTRLDSLLSPYFVVSQFTSNLIPDGSLKATLDQKALSLQKVLLLENEQKGIKVQAENDIIIAKRDSTVKVTAAAAEAKSIQLQQAALSASPQYVELIKAQKWDGKYPIYMMGNASMLMTLPK